MARITIKDVAKKCNVSTSTVSRAINNQNDINLETRDMILKTVKDLNYIPNTNARNLKIKESNAIGVLIKGLSNPFFLPMFTVLEKNINENGYKFFFHKIEENDDEIDVALKLVSEEKLKGIVFLGGFYLQDKNKLEKLKVPFVISTILNKDIKISNGGYVGVDDYMESKRMTKYLISLGHKKIAFIGARDDDISIGMLRLRGYLDALKENNIEINKNIIITTKKKIDPYRYEYGYLKSKTLFEKSRDFTAIFCISDSIAIGAIKRLEEMGYRSPDDFSVTGFDGLEINKYLTPSITTIHQPVEKIAKSACNLLFDMIKNEEQKKRIIKYEGDLWIGQTTRKI